MLGLLIVLAVVAAVIGAAVGATERKKGSETDMAGTGALSSGVFSQSGIFGSPPSAHATASSASTSAAPLPPGSTVTSVQPFASDFDFSAQAVTTPHFVTARRHF